MRAVLVVGLGNALCGDDGFGPAVLGRLRGEADLAEQVDLLLAGTDLIGAIDRFCGYDRVVLVDAVLHPARAGTVQIFTEEALASWPAPAPSGHQLSPLVALRLFRELFPGAATQISLVGLCVDRITLEAQAVDAVAVAAGVEAVRRVAGT